MRRGQGAAESACGEAIKKTRRTSCSDRQPGVAVGAETLLGASGRSGFGQAEYPSYDWHLHFEMKRQKSPDLGISALRDQTTCEPAKKADNFYGYTCEPPTEVGYVDPIDALYSIDRSPASYVPRYSLGEARAARFVPLATGRPITTLGKDTVYTVFGATGPGDGCATRWLQLWRVESPRWDLDPGNTGGLCFADTDDPDRGAASFLGLFPAIWVCQP